MLYCQCVRGNNGFPVAETMPLGDEKSYGGANYLVQAGGG